MMLRVVSVAEVIEATVEAVEAATEVTGVPPTLLLESLASLLFPSCCSRCSWPPALSVTTSRLVPLAASPDVGEVEGGGFCWSAEVIELPLLLLPTLLQEVVMARLQNTRERLKSKRKEKLQLYVSFFPSVRVLNS